MREELHNPAGLYCPTFFRMHVKTTDDLTNLNTFSEHVSATYFHEYIHYLQDISTTYGFMNISRVVNYLKYVSKEGLKNKSIKTPVIPIQSDQHYVTENIDLWRVYEGDRKNIFGSQISVLEASLVPTTIHKKTVHKLVVKIDNSGMQSNYQIGAYAICESMAYESEQMLYKNVLPAPTLFPYSSVRKLIESYSEDFPNERIWIVALCDVALMSFNPGQFLLDTLDRFNKKKISPKEPKDLYQLLNDKINFEDCSNYMELYDKMKEQAKTDLLDYFTTNIFKDNSEWIESVFTNSSTLRKKLPDFILDISSMGKIQANICFAGTLYMVGTPLVVNLNNQATFFHPLQNQKKEIDPSFLWAINQIYKSFIAPVKNRNSHCELMQWCKNSCLEQNIDDYTDERCIQNPWTRVNDKDQCIYGQLWNTWGLNGIKLTS